MPVGTRIELARSFPRQLKRVYERNEFEVGVLQDGPHRRRGRGKKTPTLRQVAAFAAARAGIDFVRRAFQFTKKRDSDAFAKAFFKFAFDPGQKSRVESALRDIVKKPILRGDYGVNRPQTARKKGSNRLFVDTGQLLRAISARIGRRRVP